MERTVRFQSISKSAGLGLAILMPIVLVAGKLCAAELPVFLDDVEGQFEALALRPDGLAFDIADSPDPRVCKHYQGLARVNGPDLTPYLFVSRSGNQPGGFGDIACPFEDDDPGNLLVVRLESRDRSGERLRSNRFVRDWPIMDDPNAFLGTPPDPRDEVVKTIYFDGTEWDDYAHPGGMQLIGDMLVLAQEAPYDESLPENLFMFIDVGDPENPDLLSSWSPPDPGDNFSAGLVGITAVRGETGACCRYVLVAAGKKNTDVRFFRSRVTDEEAGVTDLHSQDLAFDETARFSESEIEACLNIDNPAWPLVGIDWHTGGGDAHQMLNFVRQGDVDGPLYLIGARNTTPLPSGDDMLDLYRIHLDAAGVPQSCFIELVRSTHFTSKPFMGGGDSANFAAASGTYLSPGGELIVYSAEYENDGPPALEADGSRGERTVRFAEYRHRHMARPGSPTLRPSIEVEPAFSVLEGASMPISATGTPPRTRAWIQLYEDDGAGSSLPSFVDSDRWLTVDFPDRDADDFDDFGKLSFSNNAGSWRWFAPSGCTIFANDYAVSNPDFPGPDTQVLDGEGIVEVEPDLDSIAYDDDLGGVTFGADCGAYYGASIGLAWDLDENGSFETAGGTAWFDAGTLDGPSTQAVRVRAEHPTDTSVLGQSLPVAVRVEVLNADPVLQSFVLQDALGNALSGGLAFTLPGIPVWVEAAFTDPGIPDHQDATLDWGDGQLDGNTDFTEFADAYGGAQGRVSHSHVYLSAGDYPIALSVVDDDGGSVSALTNLSVLAPEDALIAAADVIESLLAATAPGPAAEALLAALEAILGNQGGAAGNGALDALEVGDPVSAITHVIEALKALQDATAAGVDVSFVSDFLGLFAESLAWQALADAMAAVNPPSKGQQKALDAIQDLTELGHSRLAADEHPGACDAFRQAVSKALRLL